MSQMSKVTRIVFFHCPPLPLLSVQPIWTHMDVYNSVSVNIGRQLFSVFQLFLPTFQSSPLSFIKCAPCFIFWQQQLVLHTKQQQQQKQQQQRRVCKWCFLLLLCWYPFSSIFPSLADADITMLWCWKSCLMSIHCSMQQLIKTLWPNTVVNKT